MCRSFVDSVSKTEIKPHRAQYTSLSFACPVAHKDNEWLVYKFAITNYKDKCSGPRNGFRLIGYLDVHVKCIYLYKCIYTLLALEKIKLQVNSFQKANNILKIKIK